MFGPKTTWWQVQHLQVIFSPQPARCEIGGWSSSWRTGSLCHSCPSPGVARNVMCGVDTTADKGFLPIHGFYVNQSAQSIVGRLLPNVEATSLSHGFGQFCFLFELALLNLVLLSWREDHRDKLLHFGHLGRRGLQYAYDGVNPVAGSRGRLIVSQAHPLHHLLRQNQYMANPW